MTPVTDPSRITLDNTFGFLDRTVSSEQLFHPLLVSNTDGNTMVKAISSELRRAKSFTFSVAFVEASAVSLLKQPLLDFEGRGTLITSTYLGFNSPSAFRELLNMPRTDVYVVDPPQGGFHAKGYLFTHRDDSTTAIIGSSNLTASALIKNHEWNLRFSALPEGDIVEQLDRVISVQLANAKPLTSEWIDEYERTYVAPARGALVLPGGNATTSIVPNQMQLDALEEIRKVRVAGETRAVIVSATGTGKTILSALDVQSFDPQRMLFVVHRDQILDRAIEEFQRVLGAPHSDFGKFVGGRRELDRRYVFGMINTISRPEALATILPDQFDYVLIDEVHRAGAPSYRRLIEHLKPKFLLGVTATPERTDDFNVFELFDFNVPYEIRLQRALEEDMLAPFHYFGVTDFEVDGEVVNDATQLSLLVAPERANHVVEALTTYGHAGVPVRGLMFCSRKDEARDLSRLLNERTVHGKRLRTKVLTGDNTIAEREDVVAELEAGSLDYVLTVDVFNEGIDIPSVNQVVMLRQTQSSIVFTQQLGRGLRKTAGKDHLIVIDFIGNYANNYLIPIALFGNTSLNKDSIRRSMIDSQEAGAISGLSSVNFDQISKERIFASLADTKLDSIQNLKRTISEMANRLGKTPKLMDFARFDSADPVVLATTRDSFWHLLCAVRQESQLPTEDQSGPLKYVSRELLNGKRPHELLVLDELFRSDATLSTRDLAELLERNGCVLESRTLRSVSRVLTQEFFTAPQRAQYGPPLVVSDDHERLTLSDDAKRLLSDGLFARHIRDVIETGLYLARHRYRWSSGLEVGERYSRKDVCRLLNWDNNEEGTINGYKVDATSATCPIFVTYHKHEDVSASTAYGDEFLNESEMHWFTRSRRTLGSAEVITIVDNAVPLHLFAKKDDVEGRDFYYLGRAHSSSARQTQMPDEGGALLNVVTMTLGVESPIEASLYDYFVANAPRPKP
ncbi:MULTISPECIES: DUF3427 domain-containing protein [unclassified Microbacterium]|uniref:DUF3427 domain-containing protein n=1 Tax=unclassified Microbacterium TaxID=2609290 RepID=UPI003659144F